MIKKLINKFKNYRNRPTWEELLDDALFYTDESISDLLLYVDLEVLKTDSKNIINFICYSKDYIYIPYFDKKSNYNRFEILGLSEEGFKYLDNFRPTLH